MKKLNLLLATMLICFYAGAQEYIENAEGDYFGQIVPQDSAIIFAPEIVSVANRYEYGLAISPNHDEVFFTCEGAEDSTQISGLLRIKREGDRWLKPQKANLNQEALWEQEAFFTPDGKNVFYAVSDSIGTKIWTSSKIADGWSKGELLNSSINNSAKRLFYTSFNSKGDMYYTNVDEFKIYKSEVINGAYNNYTDIGLPRAGHAFVALDESFIIFDSRQQDSYGKLDIYVSFKEENGSWSNPINLGIKVNSEYSETCPALSPDGKYIFFGRYNDINEKSNIYWISSDIIQKLKP
ncbi:MAG: PD40 domain-containing protein [Bacteroidales bacterium]|nr:PD40 domain-containing protein [Bacteroidales bacterium]